MSLAYKRRKRETSREQRMRTGLSMWNTDIYVLVQRKRTHLKKITRALTRALRDRDAMTRVNKRRDFLRKAYDEARANPLSAYVRAGERFNQPIAS